MELSLAAYRFAPKWCHAGLLSTINVVVMSEVGFVIVIMHGFFQDATVWCTAPPGTALEEGSALSVPVFFATGLLC